MLPFADDIVLDPTDGNLTMPVAKKNRGKNTDVEASQAQKTDVEASQAHETLSPPTTPTIAYRRNGNVELDQDVNYEKHSLAAV